MYQFLKKILSFIAYSYLSFLSLILFLVLVFNLSKTNFHSDNGNYYEEYKRLFKEKDLDILILGSSRILAAVEPKIIEEKLKLKTAQLGFSSSNLSYSRDLLLAYLENTKQTPKHVILDISWFSFDSKRLSYKPYASYWIFQNPHLFFNDLLSNKKNHLKNGFLTLIRAYERKNQKNLEYNSLAKIKSKQDSLAKTYLFKNNDLGFLKTFPDGKAKIENEEFNAFKMIVSLCKQKAINLILLTTPEDEKFSKSQQNRKKVYSIIESNISSFNWLDYSLSGRYYDENHESLLLDSHHIYYKDIFTKILLKDLKPIISNQN